LDILKLSTRLRTGTGKSYTRKVRQQGWVPAVYYGHDRQTKNIEVDLREFASVVRTKKTNHLIDLRLSGEENDSVAVIKEIQRNVLNETIFYHVDFQHVSMNEKIVVHCPVHITGKSIGVKEDGGILEQPLRQVSIECLPADIPECIEVDVSNLRIGDSIHVKDLTVANVEFKNLPDDVVAVVVLPHTAEKETPVTTQVGAEGEAASVGEAKAEKTESK